MANLVRLTFTWHQGLTRSYVVPAETEPTAESLQATIAAILELFSNNDSLLMTDQNGRAFCVLPADICNIEAERV